MWADISTILPFAFQGLQTGMGSWFRANHTVDSTNGHSWCGFRYQDYTPGFAIDMAQMTNKTFAVYPNPLWSTFGMDYCGLEAKVYNPKTGTTALLYVVDGFDSKWVKSPGSIDIMLKSYFTLIGKTTSDKNEVIPYLQWQFTGGRNPQYKFGGAGDKF